MSPNQKKVRNRARDMVGDYYRSNRYVEQENKERQKYEKKWSKSEKMLLVIIILGLLGIVVKYVLL